MGKPNTTGSVAHTGMLRDGYGPSQTTRIADLWVDAVNGDDTNDGLTPATALGTIQKTSLAKLEERIQERCGPAMHIRFELVYDIPLTKAGKRKFIISKIPMSFGND